MEDFVAKTVIDNWSGYLIESKNYFQQNWKRQPRARLTKDEFQIIRTIGHGAFGKVELAKRRGRYYAIKIIDKCRALDEDNIRNVLNERQALQATQFPFIIHMSFYFSDEQFLYFVTPYIPGGDLWYHLRRKEKLSERESRFYASQILLALEYLHYLQIIYRDLKPENILINDDGYIKLADLGFCKRIVARTYTMCGTIEYLAPEVLLNQGYGFAADWWSFGVLIYELSCGYTPFFCVDHLSMCQKIVMCEYTVPSQLSTELQDLITKLIRRDPTQRYGNMKGGVEEIKNHSWFKEVKWMSILNRKIQPPCVPKVIADPSCEPNLFEI